MKVTDCHWEQDNIGRRTVEIIMESTDISQMCELNAIIPNYEYAVVKVPMNMPFFNIGLSNLGFSCIEVQMNMGMDIKNFDYLKIQQLKDQTYFEKVGNNKDFHSVLSMITPGMFSTDRISIDPEFGMEIGCRRYKNWITTEYQTGRSSLIRIMHQGNHVGFMLIRIHDDEIILLLNGLYKPYQGKGIGLLTPASPLLYVMQEHLGITSESTSISSNNIPVVKLYNKLNFEIKSQVYVYVKHLCPQR